MHEILNQANLVVTLMLVGLIWTIQLVHYPSFHFVADEDFVAFEKMHTRRISMIVVPLMLCEGAVACWLVYATGYELRSIIGLALVVVIWVSTYALSVPCHKKLAKGKDKEVITRLVNTNWIRTILWSAKGAMLGVWS